YDDNDVYVASNQYSFANKFQFARIRCWSKAELYSGGPASYVDFAGIKHRDGSNAFAIEPARNLTPSLVGHFLATRPSGGSSVSTWTITGAYPNFVLGAANTASLGAYAGGPDGAQPGTSVLIETGDCRTQDVLWRAGSYYTGFTEKLGSGRKAMTAVRCVQVNDAGQTLRDVSYSAAG